MKVVVKRTAKKIVSMKFDDDGVLHVLANKKLSLEKVKEYVRNQRDWIAEHSGATVAKTNASLDETLQTTSSANAFVSDSCSSLDIAEMFCGKKCMINGTIFTVSPTMENKCCLDGKNILLPEKLYSTKDSRLKTLKSYIKRLSAQNVSEQISKFGSYVSLCPTVIAFKNISKGWVKCTRPTERIIILDYRICQLPDDLQHYLIVHSFAHFTNDGHNDAFWNTVSNYLPNYKRFAEELETYDFLKEI